MFWRWKLSDWVHCDLCHSVNLKCNIWYKKRNYWQRHITHIAELCTVVTKELQWTRASMKRPFPKTNCISETNVNERVRQIKQLDVVMHLQVHSECLEENKHSSRFLFHSQAENSLPLPCWYLPFCRYWKRKSSYCTSLDLGRELLQSMCYWCTANSGRYSEKT